MDDGFVSATYRWEPSTPATAQLLIVHGMSEHGRRYARTAEAFADAGWRVQAYDHRGHGASVDESHPLGHLGDHEAFDLLLRDLRTQAADLRATAPELPICILGHSMGSFVTQALLMEAPDTARAYALSGSTLPAALEAKAGRALATLERRRKGARRPSKVLQLATFGGFNRAFRPTRTEFDWLSRDAEEVDAYIADPLCGFPVSTESWRDMFGLLARLAAAESHRRVPAATPIYLMSGSEDPVGGRRGVERLAAAWARAGATNLRVRLFEGARHETLNETNREEVVRELREWFEAQLRS